MSLRFPMFRVLGGIVEHAGEMGFDGLGAHRRSDVRAGRQVSAAFRTSFLIWMKAVHEKNPFSRKWWSRQIRWTAGGAATISKATISKELGESKFRYRLARRSHEFVDSSRARNGPEHIAQFGVRGFGESRAGQSLDGGGQFGESIGLPGP